MEYNSNYLSIEIMQQPLSEGTLLEGKYRIVKRLGTGGFGITYEALDESVNLQVAIKELFPNGLMRAEGAQSISVPPGGATGEGWTPASFARLRADFQREGKVLARLKHEGIVKVITRFEANSTAYLVMEFIPGQSLLSYSQECGPLPWAEALALIHKTGEAVTYLHDQGIFHRDLHPLNVLLRPQKDGSLLPIVIDFGLAREGTETRSSKPFAYKGYAPLERYIPEKDEQGNEVWALGPFIDVYSLAALLFRLLTGERPQEAILRYGGAELPAPRERILSVPAWLSEAVMQGLALRRNDRPQTIEAFLALLTPPQVTQPKPEAKPKVEKKPPSTGGVLTRRLLLGAGVVGLVGAGILAGTKLENNKPMNNSGASPQSEEPVSAKISKPGKPAPAVTKVAPPVANRKLPATYPAPKTLAEYRAQMMAIPGGSFARGSEKYPDEKNGGTVTLSGFKMGRTPVTVAMFQEFCTKTGRPMPPAPDGYIWKGNWSGVQDHPMVNVSWTDCKAYADWAKLRLPTEAEFEYASHGGKAWEYPWSDKIEDSKLWYTQTSKDSGTASVSRSNNVFVNGYGLVDMSGNVWQWCSDWYGNYPGGDETNPQGVSSGTARVLRGGSWFSINADYFRCAYRNWYNPSGAYDNWGFRLIHPGP